MALAEGSVSVEGSRPIMSAKKRFNSWGESAEFPNKAGVVIAAFANLFCVSIETFDSARIDWNLADRRWSTCCDAAAAEDKAAAWAAAC